MKGKLILLMTVAVVVILPAVASAHSSGYGYNYYGYYSDCWNHFWHKTVNPQIDVEPGPNYVSAESVGSIHWNKGSTWSGYNTYCPSGGQSAGEIDLEGIANMTTTMINVIDINVTNPGSKCMSTITLEVGVIGDFPHGTSYVISKEKTDFDSASQNWTAFSHTDYNSVTFHFSLNPGITKTFYIGFYLPPSGDYPSSNGNLWYQLTTG